MFIKVTSVLKRCPTRLLFIIIAMCEGCVERLDIAQIATSNLPIVLNGFISDQPGPYHIKISRSFNIGTASSYQAPISVKELVLSDNLGTKETLLEVTPGNYETSPGGIRGVAGRIYKLNVELLNGKKYESVADTLSAPGNLDTVYYKFRTFATLKGTKDYYFDIYLDAGNSIANSYYYLWKFKGTYKVITNPEADKEEEPCSYTGIDCAGCSVCNKAQKCTGLRNIAPISSPSPIYFRFKPCDCCTCWYTIYSESPVISNYQFLQADGYKNIRVGTILIDNWMLQHKIYAEVNQLSLTRQGYQFYKAIKDQQEGAASLFQPASGRIPGNIEQKSGSSEPIVGIFYAASISSKTIIITKQDVPPFTYDFLPEGSPLPPKNCLNLYPNSTNVKPSFWQD